MLDVRSVFFHATVISVFRESADEVTVTLSLPTVGEAARLVAFPVMAAAAYQFHVGQHFSITLDEE